jgi:hypothetical protein
MCTTLKKELLYGEGARKWPRKWESRKEMAMKSLCYERICGYCVGRKGRKASLRGRKQ